MTQGFFTFLWYDGFMLNYNIKGTGLDISDELRSYAEKGLQQAEKFVHDSTAHADIELEYQAMREGERNRAEFTLSVQAQVYRAEAWGATIHAAIDLAIEELSSELRRSKKKRLDVVRRSAAKAKQFLQGLRSRI